MKINKNGTIETTESDYRMIFGGVKKLLVRLRIPKNKKDKIGIVIAIKTENEKEKIQLQNDLIEGLRKYLHESQIPPVFNIISLPERHSVRINSCESSLQYLKKIRGHFIVYGSVTKRKDKGAVNFVFKLEGSVIHRPVPQILSNRLAREFAELLPRRRHFPEDEELSGFEITQQWLGFVTKYIIGIAAFISSDLDLAYKVYNQLKKELKFVRPTVPALVKIKERLPRRLEEASNAICLRLYFLYTKTRDKRHIEKQKEYLDLLNQLSPHNYSARLSRAIYLFLMNKNVDGAINELKRIKNPLDPTWRYNLAFLFAYKGELSRAKKQYDKALEGRVGPNVINDIEVFISDVLSQESGKFQLYFARGYINYRAKGDLSLAKQDFKTFVEKASDGIYKEEVRLAKIYLEQIK